MRLRKWFWCGWFWFLWWRWCPPLFICWNSDRMDFDVQTKLTGFKRRTSLTFLSTFFSDGRLLMEIDHRKQNPGLWRGAEVVYNSETVQKIQLLTYCSDFDGIKGGVGPSIQIRARTLVTSLAPQMSLIKCWAPSSYCWAAPPCKLPIEWCTSRLHSTKLKKNTKSSNYIA